MMDSFWHGVKQSCDKIAENLTASLSTTELLALHQEAAACLSLVRQHTAWNESGPPLDRGLEDRELDRANIIREFLEVGKLAIPPSAPPGLLEIVGQYEHRLVGEQTLAEFTDDLARATGDVRNIASRVAELTKQRERNQRLQPLLFHFRELLESLVGANYEKGAT